MSVSHSRLWLFRLILGAAVAATASGISALPEAKAQPMTRAEARARAASLESLGRRLFSDPRLSPTGTIACASCHDPRRQFGPPNALSVQFGGADAREPGLRAVPSIKYLQAVPQFTEHFFESEDEADESIDNGPTGGLTWDGRADTAHDQARIPLLSPFEMGNRDAKDVVDRARAAGYGPAIAALDAAAGGSDIDAAFRTILKSFEVYEQDPETFYPYSSKYDAYLDGKAQLSSAETRGLKLFEDPAKGNCASCHVSERGADGTPPQFTDYGMIALGAPRNKDIPANADPTWFDLGLCGPLRTDFMGKADYCSLFRTPSLRNVATRSVFFHNGALHTLRDAVAFYATRDVDPGRWYPKNAAGTIDTFDDMPPAYRLNVNMDPPFGGKPGDRPVLNQSEIDDIVAFLHTLTDGYALQRLTLSARPKQALAGPE